MGGEVGRKGIDQHMHRTMDHHHAAVHSLWRGSSGAGRKPSGQDTNEGSIADADGGTLKTDPQTSRQQSCTRCQRDSV
jgi:hypothetical protein